MKEYLVATPVSDNGKPQNMYENLKIIKAETPRQAEDIYNERYSSYDFKIAIVLSEYKQAT